RLFSGSFTAMFACPATDDFFRARIDQMIDLRHPLAVLASRMPWQEIEAAVAHRFVRKAHEGEAMPDLDLFVVNTPWTGCCANCVWQVSSRWIRSGTAFAMGSGSSTASWICVTSVCVA